MRRRLLLALIVVVCALGGIWTGLRLVGPTTYSTALGDVQLRVHPALPSHRGLQLYVPLADWGLRARIIGAPLAVDVEPRRIDRTGLLEAITEGSQRLPALRAELRDDLRDAVVRALVVSLLGALAGGFVAVLFWERLGVRGRPLLFAPVSGLATAVVVAVGLAGWSAVTWDPGRLERPTYYASGDELQRLLEQADQLRRTGEKYAGRVDVAIRSIAGLLNQGGDTVDPPDGGTRVLLASDIHNNVLPLPTLKRFSARRPVFLPGDFTINGSRFEVGLVRGVAKLGRPVAAVSGNHDSNGLMRQLARTGIRVFTHRGVMDVRGRVHGPAVQDVGGLSVAGFEDPLAFSRAGFPNGLRSGISFTDIPDGHERFLRALADRWRWWQELPRRPQVLMVHEEALGRELANLIWAADPDGPPLAILVGHTHRQRLERYGPVTLVNGGSAGAGGVFGAGSTPVGFALLDFDATGRLDATDLVEQNPFDGSAQARRVITSRPDCDNRVVFCNAKPVLPDLPGSAISAPTGPRGPASR